MSPSSGSSFDALFEMLFSRLWQLSLRVQGRTFGAPGLTARTCTAGNGRGQAGSDERPGWPAVGGRGQIGGAPLAVRQLSSRPSGGSPTARRAAAPGGPGDRPPAVTAVSARCRARPRRPGRQPRVSYAVAGKVTDTGAERRALSGSAPPALTVLRIPQAERAFGAPLSTPGMGDRLGVKVPWRKRWC